MDKLLEMLEEMSWKNRGHGMNNHEMAFVGYAYTQGLHDSAKAIIKANMEVTA